MCTTLGAEGPGKARQIKVGTVEHLLAAIAGCHIDNLVIELNGPEVPIMDGSSAPFVFLIDCAGVAEQRAERRAIQILKHVAVGDQDAMASLAPSHGFSVSFEIDFEAAAIARQEYFISLDNAVVVDGDRIMNPGGLRYENEFVRHKVLDAVGDLALAGAPILGHFHGFRSGHGMHHKLLRALFADREAWRSAPLADAGELAPSQERTRLAASA